MARIWSNSGRAPPLITPCSTIALGPAATGAGGLSEMVRQVGGDVSQTRANSSPSFRKRPDPQHLHEVEEHAPQALGVSPAMGAGRGFQHGSGGAVLGVGKQYRGLLDFRLDRVDVLIHLDGHHRRIGEIELGIAEFEGRQLLFLALPEPVLPAQPVRRAAAPDRQPAGSGAGGGLRRAALRSGIFFSRLFEEGEDHDCWECRTVL